MTFDPISQDAPHDSDYPAQMVGIHVDHNGAQLNGTVYLPAGEGKFPLVLLLHGIPGHERNFDLAQILRRAGYATCVFHYRGSWGSGADYRFAHVLEDSAFMVDYFTQQTELDRIDPNNIIVIGHSLGGWAALLTARKEQVKAVASISGLNVGGVWGGQLQEAPEMVRPMLLQTMQEFLIPLAGVTPEDIVNEVENNVSAWDLLQNVSATKDKPVLLVGAKRDMVVSPFDNHMPLKKAYEKADAPQLTTALLSADHSYNSHRIELAQTVLDWLATLQ